MNVQGAGTKSDEMCEAPSSLDKKLARSLVIVADEFGQGCTGTN